MKALLANLQQRKVIRVTGVYAVTGYAIFQIANSLLPALNLPEWTVTLSAVVFLLGFPVVVALSYLYDWTATGLERTARDDAVAPGPAVAPARLGWLNWTLLAVTGAVLVAVATFYVAVPIATRSDGATTTAGVAPEKSIAVLPFVNFGAPGEIDYFADGLTEELINGLAQLPDLKVAGRTSSFYFKDRQDDLREIGRRLGVAHVLEGSVRRSGDNLRITAQLIQVSDGFHLLSEVFDRPIGDTFAVQTQIARAVAERLEARLLGPAEGAGARDPRGYELELTARSRLRKLEPAELEAARELYRELIALEPGNANAHAGFAEATIMVAQTSLALDFGTARAESEAAVATALRLDPGSSESWRVRGFVNYVLSIRTGEQRYADSAIADLQRAVEIDPRNADALAQLAALQLAAGRVEQATATLRRSLEIDPLSRTAQQLLGTALSQQGRLGEARRQFESLIELYPEFTSARIALAGSLIGQGLLDETVALLDDPALVASDLLAAVLLANCYANLDLAREFTVTLESVVAPRLAATIAEFVRLQRAGALDAIDALAERERAATDEPFWDDVRLMVAVRRGDAEAAERVLAGMSIEPVEEGAAPEQRSATDALLIAEALRLVGEPEQAQRRVEALLRRFGTAPDEYISNDARIVRALALAWLGRPDESIEEIAQATSRGYRTLIDLEYFLRPEEYPFMQAVARDARYVALVDTIEADNRRMRDSVLARRREAGDER